MNITLKVSDKLGQRAKHYAVDAHKSLSAIVTELLEQKLTEESQLEQDARHKSHAELVERVNETREKIRREAGEFDVRELIDEGRRY